MNAMEIKKRAKGGERGRREREREVDEGIWKRGEVRELEKNRERESREESGERERLEFIYLFMVRERERVCVCVCVCVFSMKT